ncbi:MAG: hypothetical protein D4S01_03950 [Dehalococcoidia bacterium]|nr:MAG: hypothetical protein D4S01_03950 [Dehalococcoidia bacterium]
MTMVEVCEFIATLNLELPENVRMKPFIVKHNSNPGWFARKILKKKPQPESKSVHVSIFTVNNDEFRTPNLVQAWLFNRMKLDYKAGRREAAILRDALQEWKETFIGG